MYKVDANENHLQCIPNLIRPRYISRYIRNWFRDRLTMYSCSPLSSAINSAEPLMLNLRLRRKEVMTTIRSNEARAGQASNIEHIIDLDGN